MTTNESQNLYDDYPYPNLTHGRTHPEHLETMATLLGMDPAPADRCRVLELGCASGFNLFPRAHASPKSYFTGID